ncbi:MAG: DUF4349 domain-containing protein [Candidatus Limnocylindrales bacterium]
MALSALIVFTLVVAACAGGASQQILSTVGAPVGGQGQTVEDGSGAEAAASAAPAAAPGEGNGGGDGVGAPVDDARIIRTGTIDLEVGDVGTALTTARNAIRTMGGYIGASTTQNDGDTPIASVTYRIPADRWEDALDLLRAISGPGTKVVSERTEAVEVTGQVVDLNARIKNLRASEASLQEIAGQATKIADVLQVQDQLTNVRGQIEQLTAALKDLEDRSAYATLTASFRVPIVAVEIAQKGWDPKVVVDEASASLVTVVQALTSAGIWFAIVWLPILLVLGVLILVVSWFVRRVGLVGPRRPKGGEIVAS